MPYEIPQTPFDPHPEGEHIGTITEVRDQGMQQTLYGEKHKLVIIITSHTALEDSGEPFQLWVWVTLSSGTKATLTALRQKLLRRPLSELERKSFDPDTEMIGRKVKYFVEHNYGDEGRTFANLVTWALIQPNEVDPEPPPPQPTEPPPITEPPPPSNDDDDLPF